MSKLKYGVYNGRTIKRILENSRLYFLTAFFIIGIIIGAVSIKSDSGGVTDSLRQVVESYTKLRAEQGIAANFCNSFAINALFSAAVIFLGFSLIGYPFIMLTPIVKGMGIGMVSGYMYSVYKFIGLAYSLLIIYPGAVISVFALSSLAATAANTRAMPTPRRYRAGDSLRKTKQNYSQYVSL